PPELALIDRRAVIVNRDFGQAYRLRHRSLGARLRQRQRRSLSGGGQRGGEQNQRQKDVRESFHLFLLRHDELEVTTKLPGSGFLDGAEGVVISFQFSVICPDAPEPSRN